MIDSKEFNELVTVCKDLSELFDQIFADGWITKGELTRARKELDMSKLAESLIEIRGELVNTINSSIIKGTPEQLCGRISVGNFAAAGEDIISVTIDNQVFDTTTPEGLYQYVNTINEMDINEEETVHLEWKK